MTVHADIPEDSDAGPHLKSPGMDVLDAVREQLPISITDTSGLILEVNDAFCRLSGYTPTQLYGKPHRIMNSGVHTDAFFAEMWRALESGASWRGEICNRAADGSLYWVDTVISPLRNASGEIERYISLRFDITQRVLQQHALDATRERLSAATEAGEIGIWELDIAQGTIHWDGCMHCLYGLGTQVTITTSAQWLARIHPDDRQRVDDAFGAALRSGPAFEEEFRVIWADASVHHLHTAGQIKRDARGRALRAVGVTWDVTHVRSLWSELEQHKSLMSVALEAIADAVITSDTAGKVTWMNPAAERVTGWTCADVIGAALEQVCPLTHDGAHKILGMTAGANHGPHSHNMPPVKAQLITPTGAAFAVMASAAPMYDADRQIGMVTVLHDVTEQQRLGGEMRYRDTHDKLTGLINRTEFETRMSRLIGGGPRAANHVLLYIDLDQFKIVNDACGHAIGDQALRQVAALLGNGLREQDTVARLGGDEFAVVLPNCGVKRALAAAQAICQRLDQFRFKHEGRRYRIGASIGLIPIDTRWDCLTGVLKAADTACYAAKEAGRNRVHVWLDGDGSMTERHAEMQWASRTEQALDENRLVLFAQSIEPIRKRKHSESGQGVGLHAEALLRMIDRDGSVIPPGMFLPAAERFGLCARIDRWVLDRAIGHLKALPQLADVEMLCVNLSGQSVGDKDFHRLAIRSLMAAGPDVAHRLCLEITETAAITNMADAAAFIAEIRSLGVLVALDDFGAGASSFGYLKTLKVDILKIDGQFVRNLIKSSLDDATVRCFVEVAGIVGLKTVAEFVDCPEVLDRLRCIGVDYAQGFLLHRPRPIAEVLSVAERPTCRDDTPIDAPLALANSFT